MSIKCENCGRDLKHKIIAVIAWDPYGEYMVYFCSDKCFDQLRIRCPLSQLVALKKRDEK